MLPIIYPYFTPIYNVGAELLQFFKVCDITGGDNPVSQIITAIFENGVFKPLQKVDIKEHEKIEIKILSVDEWQKRFNHIIN